MLSTAYIDRIFPFAFILGDDLGFIRTGPSLRAVCPDARPGTPLTASFTVERPDSKMAIGSAWLRRHLNHLFVLRHRVSGLQFRGQWIVRDEGESALIFVGSPWLTHPDQLEQFGLKMSDFAIHDPMVDLLQSAQAQQLALDDVKQLAAKLTQQRAELRLTNQQLAAQNAALLATERRLREQEAEARKLAFVAARTTNGVVITDGAGQIEWVNQAFTRLTGYAVEEVRGRRPGSFLQGPLTDRQTVEEMHQLGKEGEGFERDLVNYDKAGQPYIVHIEVQPIRDEQGRMTNLMAIESNVTERVLNDSRRTLGDLISRTLATAESLQAGFEGTLEALARVLNFRVGLSWEVRRGGHELEPQFDWTDGGAGQREFVARSRELRLRPGQDLPGCAWAGKTVEWITDLSQEGSFLRAGPAAQAGLGRAIAFPVLVFDSVVGVMELLGPRDYLPDGELPNFLQGVGRQVGLFVARLHAQEALRAERDSAIQVMSLMGQGIAVTDADRRIEYCNEALVALLGRPQEQLIGQSPPELLAEGRLTETSTRRVTFETRLERPDGSTVFLLVTSVPRLLDGSPVGHIVTVTDLSDRKKI